MLDFQGTSDKEKKIEKVFEFELHNISDGVSLFVNDDYLQFKMVVNKWQLVGCAVFNKTSYAKHFWVIVSWCHNSTMKGL